MYNVDG